MTVKCTLYDSFVTVGEFESGRDADRPGAEKITIKFC